MLGAKRTAVRCRSLDRGVFKMSSPSLGTREACVARDLSDPLDAFRDRFVIPDRLIYLDGNSLGPMPRAATDVLHRTIAQEWEIGRAHV